MSWSWCWPNGGLGDSLCRGPKVGAGLPMVGLNPDMAGCRAVVILGMVFTCWWVGLGSRGSGNLVPAHWCMMLFLELAIAYGQSELGPRVSGCRALEVSVIVLRHCI